MGADIADVTGDGVADEEVTVNEWAKLAILLAGLWLLSPIDLQVVKAAGVTFDDVR